jgi:hypothetical protein
MRSCLYWRYIDHSVPEKSRLPSYFLSIITLDDVVVDRHERGKTKQCQWSAALTSINSAKVCLNLDVRTSITKTKWTLHILTVARTQFSWTAPCHVDGAPCHVDGEPCHVATKFRWILLYQVVEIRYEKYVFTGVLMKYHKKRKMDEPDWLLELFIIPIRKRYYRCGNELCIDYKYARHTV